MRISIRQMTDSGMPGRVMSLIEELFDTCIGLCEKLGMPHYYLNRNWGELGEGCSLALYRKDFNRFIELAGEKLPTDRYFLQHAGSDEFWPGPQARLRIHGTLMEDPVFGDLAVHQGIYINIYPLDGLAGPNFLQQRQMNLFKKIQSEILSCDYDDEKTWKRLLDKRKKFMESHPAVSGKWMIVYPMLPDDISNCIISSDELMTTDDLSINLNTSYSGWVFDIADDI